MLTPQLIHEVTERLVKRFDPVAIYLFGSHAWGTPHKDSDIDLLIVVDELKQKQWEACSQGYDALFDIDMPQDIVVYPKAEFDEKSKRITSLFRKIKEEGKLLYARA